MRVTGGWVTGGAELDNEELEDELDDDELDDDELDETFFCLFFKYKYPPTAAAAKRIIARKTAAIMAPLIVVML